MATPTSSLSRIMQPMMRPYPKGKTESASPKIETHEPDGGNLYRSHPLLVNSGQYWRCAHGQTGYASAMEWVGCGLCAEADPEALRLWMRPNDQGQQSLPAGGDTEIKTERGAGRD